MPLLHWNLVSPDADMNDSTLDDKPATVQCLAARPHSWSTMTAQPLGPSPGVCTSPHEATTLLPHHLLTSMLADIPILSIPNIVNWFLYLAQHPQYNQDEITFALFQPALKWQGFFCISQLISNLVCSEHLVKRLGIEFGVAVLVFQYAEQDLVVMRQSFFGFP